MSYAPQPISSLGDKHIKFNGSGPFHLAKGLVMPIIFNPSKYQFCWNKAG